MRVTIKGITPSTIAFNTLGIIIRGDSNNMELYPESVAKSIDVLNEDQLTEVNSLVNAKLIKIEVEETEPAKKPKVTVEDLTGPVEKTPIPEKTTNEDEDVEDEDVEDAPTKTEEPKEAPKKRGRPKGSKDKAKRKATSKKTTAKKKTSKKSSAKKVSKAKPVQTQTDEPESKAVIMTPDGPKSGKMKKSAVGDIGEGEITQASIDAMEKLEAEEKADRNLPDSKVDESKLAVQDRMGEKAVVSANGEAKGVKMENSVIPEAKQIKDRAVEFIDQEEKDLDEKAKEAFLDKDDGDDDLDFLEY